MINHAGHLLRYLHDTLTNTIAYDEAFILVLIFSYGMGILERDTWVHFSIFVTRESVWYYTQQLQSYGLGMDILTVIEIWIWICLHMTWQRTYGARKQQIRAELGWVVTQRTVPDQNKSLGIRYRYLDLWSQT